MTKPAKTYLEQLQILKDRGRTVPDEPFELSCLTHHNDYRLFAYRFPFTLPGQPDQFQLIDLLYTLAPDLYEPMGFPVGWQRLPLWHPLTSDMKPA